MDFSEIEQRRRAAGISQYALCRRSGVHPSTYYRLTRSPDRGQRRTLARLEKALRALLDDAAGRSAA